MKINESCLFTRSFASLFNVSKEFTVECNPESLDLEKIQLYKKLGVNRISLGVQTFNDRLLKVINRKHRKEDIFQVIQLLKENGINNISIDLIYALPEQRMLKKIWKFSWIWILNIYRSILCRLKKIQSLAGRI